MLQRILLCTDLDRTLLPNGALPESPRAREVFARFVGRQEVTLAYVSGRHLELVLDAISTYQLPLPDWIVSDVGTTIYQFKSDEWQPWQEWEQNIGAEWPNLTAYDLRPMFADLAVLRLQEEAKQNRYKLSYYLPLRMDIEALKQEIERRLNAHNLSANLIISNDNVTGLLDILPTRGTKRHAIGFLMRKQGFEYQNTIFAGDSGNDLPVLVSEIKSVLVANCTDELAQQAQAMSLKQGTDSALYLAQGGFMGMNGNYSAGILEGIAHFLPHSRSWME